jgi:hypothetical protein
MKIIEVIRESESQTNSGGSSDVDQNQLTLDF